MKWPMPRPVFFSPEIASITDVTSRWSPGTNGRS